MHQTLHRKAVFHFRLHFSRQVDYLHLQTLADCWIRLFEKWQLLRELQTSCWNHDTAPNQLLHWTWALAAHADTPENIKLQKFWRSAMRQTTSLRFRRSWSSGVSVRVEMCQHFVISNEFEVVLSSSILLFGNGGALKPNYLTWKASARPNFLFLFDEISVRRKICVCPSYHM